MRELDVVLPDGRSLHAYDSRGDDDGNRLVVIWHHGTPNIGLPPEPLFAASTREGIAWVGYDRPGYGGSDPHPGRDVGSAARDVAALADALGIRRFAAMGHSGGGPHALACAALLPERVAAVVVGASLAPLGADGLDWFVGMGPTAEASLRAALAGRVAKERFEAAAQEAGPDFVAADWQALEGAWSWFGKVVGPALRSGPAPLIDDDLAYVAPWGFDPSAITAPALVLHGELDRVVPATHGMWLANRIAGAELRLAPNEGHISVLRHAGDAIAWLARSANWRG
jgi:pimeloyl-ACP methyl ester carboxylesterase